MNSRQSGVLLLLLCIASGCSLNEPPFYERRAHEFLWKQGTPDAVIEKLTKRKPLAPAEAEQLAGYQNVAVLHLLGCNPGTPLPVLEQLARHRNGEVRSGVADNPNAPVEVLLKLRSVGRYTTVNTLLARNPRLPPAVLLEMHQRGEALLSSFAMNPNCPPELMRKIAARGSDIDRAWLAANPGLPEDLAKVLARDSSPMVRGHFESNPKYGGKGQATPR